MAKYFSGTSGLVLPYKNKSFYPPEFQDQSRLAFYSHLFRSIEINSSFYKIPRAQTIEKWAAIVPPHFRFTFKLWKEITHSKDFHFQETDIQKFMAAVDAVGARKGCLLVQLPPSLKFLAFWQLQQLLRLIHKYNNDDAWNICVEFRDSSWYRPEVYDFFNEQKAALVIHDKKGSQSPMEELDAPFLYLRFHGPSGNYRDSYDDAFLLEYSYYIKEWLDAGKTVYAYFNNTIGDAIKNLRTLNDYVSGH